MFSGINTNKLELLLKLAESEGCRVNRFDDNHGTIEFKQLFWDVKANYQLFYETGNLEVDCVDSNYQDIVETKIKEALEKIDNA